MLFRTGMSSLNFYLRVIPFKPRWNITLFPQRRTSDRQFCFKRPVVVILAPVFGNVSSSLELIDFLATENACEPVGFRLIAQNKLFTWMIPVTKYFSGICASKIPKHHCVTTPTKESSVSACIEMVTLVYTSLSIEGLANMFRTGTSWFKYALRFLCIIWIPSEILALLVCCSEWLDLINFVCGRQNKLVCVIGCSLSSKQLLLEEAHIERWWGYRDSPIGCDWNSDAERQGMKTKRRYASQEVTLGRRMWVKTYDFRSTTYDLAIAK